MPTTNTTPRQNLDAATDRLIAASIAVAYIDSLPAGEKAGYVTAKIKFASARKRYLAAREAYLAACPTMSAKVPALVAA